MEDGEDFERYCSRMAQVTTSTLVRIVCKVCCNRRLLYHRRLHPLTYFM